MKEYTTLKPCQEISATGVVYEKGSLYEYFHNLNDPRHAKGKRYSLTTLLLIIFLGKLAGKDNPVEISDWARNHAEELMELLGLERSWMPSHSTIRRVFNEIVDEDEFDRLVEAYHQGDGLDEDDILALDGKTLHGTRAGDKAQGKHLLSIYAVKTQRVLAQKEVEAKENEITASPQLLAKVDVNGKIVVGDALHTQRKTSQQILSAGGDYLWPVKENHPRMYADIERLFTPEKPRPGFGAVQKDFREGKQVSYGHGRLEVRTIQTSTMMNDYLDWPGLQQVYRLERRFSWFRNGEVYKTSHEVEFGLTSLPREKASPKRLINIRRQYWRIETGLHYRRDVTFREDATRMTIGAAGRILASVHNLVIGLIKKAGFTNAAKARRYFEGHLQEAFSLLTTAHCLS